MPSVAVTGFANIEASLRQIIVAINQLNTTLGIAFPAPLTGSKTFNPPSINDAASATTTVSVVGAALGNYAQAGFSLSLAGLTLNAYVSATDTVTVVFSNLTGSPVDLGSGTLTAKVYTH